MRVNNINTKISYRAKLSDDVQKSVNRQGLCIWERKGVNSREFKHYQDDLKTIETLFPDGVVCFDEKNKYKLLLKHDGKKDILLIENHSPFLVQAIAGGLNTAMRNIKEYLADK